MNGRAKYSLAEAKARIEAFCAYQERCEFEVRQKLKTWRISTTEFDQIIDHLVDLKFIDEERFAFAFVSGKFKIKRWGRNKIRAKLKEKRISDSLINKALHSLSDSEYAKTIDDLVDYKYGLLGDRSWDNKVKVKRFLVSRGFEYDLINKALE